jgi:hypothetical protein
LLLGAGGVIATALPKGHRWLFTLGVVGSVVTAVVFWVDSGYEDFEGPAWYGALVFTFGVAGGFLIREIADAWNERRKWR